MNNFKKFALLPVVLAILSGCSSVTQTKIDADVRAANETLAARQEAIRASIIEAEAKRLQAQIVNKPYLAGNSLPLARGVAMPDVLAKNMPLTALFSKGSVDLQTAISQVGEAARITITATPDALLPPQSFSLKNKATNPPVSAPVRITLQSQGQLIWEVLDDIARQAQISWRPVPGGAEFYRLETKVFYLAAIPQVASTSASLGRNGGSSAFDTQSKTSFETKDQNLIKGLQTTIDAVLTQGGNATISQESQTVVITDTKDGVERAENLIKDLNKAMSRRVRVLIEAIEVVDKDNSELSVDWNLLYSTASEAIKISSIASLASTQAGQFGVNAPSTSPAAGSSLIIKALNEVGTVVNRRSFPLLTTSGRPVTQAIRSTFNYVDQVQTSSVASSTTTTTAPTVVQKDETVGTFLTMVPTAKPDGSIILSVSFDVTNAQPLSPFTIGSGTTAVTVQQKTIDGTGVIGEVPVRSGQTVVLGGIETQVANDTTRRVGNGAPILAGGSDLKKFNKSRMILLATAVTEEGI